MPQDPALQLIARIRDKSYVGLSDFRGDLMAYLEAVEKRNYELRSVDQIREAWGDALGWLRGEYWHRFLFDAETELRAFA